MYISHISHGDIFTKIKALLGPSFAISLAYVAQSIIVGTDVLMIGWLGVEHLAASGYVVRLYILGFLMTVGFAIVVSPLMGQALGTHNRIKARQVAQQIFWILLGVGTLGYCVMRWALPHYLNTIEQSYQVKQYAMVYGYWLFLSLPIAGYVPFFRLYMTVHTGTKIFAWIAFFMVICNAVLDYILIFGVGAWDGFGIQGASLATLSITILQSVVLGYCIYTLPLYRPHRLFVGIFHWHVFKKRTLQIQRIFAIGVPISMRMIGESLLASIYFIIVAMGGIHFAAAYQVATQMETIIGFFTIGIMITINSQVSLAKGKHDVRGMVLTLVASTVLLAMIMVPISVLLYVYAPDISKVFLPDTTAQMVETRSILIHMFGIGAMYHLVRMMQIVIMGTFDGLGETTMPAMIQLASMWCIGGLGGYALSITVLSGYGVMISHLVAVLFCVIINGWFLYKRLRYFERNV